MPVNLVNVHGTEFLASDTREQYRQKLARITLDSMVQFVGLLDAKGTVLEINQVALDGGGLRLSDVEGKPFWTTFWWQVSEDINAGLKDAIARAARGEFVRWDTEIFGRASGKETIVIDASLMPVKDEQGNVVFIAAEGRDITEKKAYERQIARQREELAKLDELKTAFFANISHEFRTPLTLMLGPLEDAMAAGEEPLGARQRERITMVQRNGLRLQKLVNALLDFSRVEAGRIQAVYQPTDLAALTHDLASSFRSACEKAGLRLTIDTPPLPEPVFVDHEMWEKIVLNLVSNAFKFTLEGGIKVDVSADGGQAVLRVSDTGTGIPEAELPRIFERFHRVTGARGRTHEGTGIGLALVKELIELHKGTVSVESTVGKGTTFTVRVPFGRAHLPQDRLEASRTQASTATRADAFVSEALRWLPDGMIAEELDAQALDDQAEPLPTPEGPAGERARVLLADDNADMRDYLTRLLATSYEVTAVADGEAALAAAREQRPDLILTDVMMPRLDGFGLLEKLCGDPELRSVPVIVLSARAGDEAKVEGLRRGADDYLVKPFGARELRARVAANIDRAKLYRAAQDELARRERVEQSLRESEARYRSALTAGQMGNWETDFLTRTRTWSEEGLALFGLALADGRGIVGDEADEYIAALHPDDRHLVQKFRDLADRQDSFPAEYRIRRPDGTIRWLSGRGQVVARGADGKAQRLVSIMADVTDRKAVEDHIQFLMREISHRSKNLLSVVQAIAAQTGRSAGSIDDFQLRFSHRLQGLAASHDLLVHQNWQGATLADLVRDQVAPFVDIGSARLNVAGPHVFVSPDAAEALGMAFHELATNAVKHGALSVPGGRVAVTWAVNREGPAPPFLWTSWVERGGPCVTSPSRKGFGHVVFERIITKSLGGEVAMDFAPEGLSWELSIPMSRLRP